MMNYDQCTHTLQMDFAVLCEIYVAIHEIYLTMKDFALQLEQED